MDLIIFVQVYKTIDKNFKIIDRFWKKKESKVINKKEA